MEDLKNCPFCGEAAEIQDHRLVWSVTCSNKKCQVCILGERAPEPDDHESDEYWKSIKQTAIDRWNTRTSTQISKLEEVTKEMLKKNAHKIDVNDWVHLIVKLQKLIDEAKR